MDLKNELKSNQTNRETVLDEFKIETDNNKKNFDKIDLEEINKINNSEKHSLSEKLSDAVIFIQRPLCADYHSESDSDKYSSDSEHSVSSNSIISEDINDFLNTEKEKEKRLCKKQDCTDLAVSELPPIEDLKISVPEKECMEIGIITNIVDVLVVVEAYKGTPALDVDTVLFLEFGSKTLGKIFEVLGPITEPIYSVRFNSKEQILKNMIKKGLIVYYAPKSQHTTFVFLSEVLKIKGSDASWKDNVEAPPEFQDFSDDETEKHFKSESVKQEQSTHLYKPLNSKKKPLFKFIRQNNYQKMRDGRFRDSRNLNGRFKNSIITTPITQNINWTNDINPIASMSINNLKNSFSSKYTPPYNNPNATASSSFVYFFPRHFTPFPDKLHLQYFQEQNRGLSEGLEVQWPLSSPSLPSLQNNDKKILFE